MLASEQTYQQIERALRKAHSKFQDAGENTPLTDIFLQVKQESGELLIFDDDDREITRCVVEEWIGNVDEDFYENVVPVLRLSLINLKELTENFNVLKPYSFVLQDDERETVEDLYLVDDDTIVIDSDLLADLDDDLNAFWEELSKS